MAGLALLAAPPQPPPLGSIKRGELLVDAQTRALWLGVDATLDPKQALLISDIVSLLDQIALLNTNLRAYTDAQVATRAPIDHTHTMDDITDLPSGGGGGGAVPPYCIIMYSGSLAAIPVGYVFCDGNNGTPNMQDRFIICKGPTYGHMTAGGGATNLTTDVQGNHSHGGSTQYHTLSLHEMPVHAHSVYDPTHYHPLYDPGHSHGYSDMWPENTYTPGIGGASAQWGIYDHGRTTSHVATGAYANYAATGISLYNNGGGGAHLHLLTVDGGHAHNISGNVIPWYYALAFIMKLP